MKGKLRYLALALVAVSAIGAQAAQAHEFKASATPYAVTGEFDEGATKFTLTASGLTTTCESALFEGTGTAASSKELTITPTIGKTVAPSGCKTSTGSEAFFHTNHCAFIYTGETVGEHAPVHFECSGATENKIQETIPALGVTLSIGEQTPGGGVHYTNLTEGGKEIVTIHTTITGLTVGCTPALACSFIGGGTLNATLEGTEKFKAYKDTGTPGEGTAKTTPVISEGEQINFSVK